MRPWETGEYEEALVRSKEPLEKGSLVGIGSAGVVPGGVESFFRMELERYIRQQGEGYLDSQGEFILDPDAAFEKMGASSLVGSMDYLLKAVQAGVLLNAGGGIRCKFAVNTVKVEFFMRREHSIGPQALVDALTGAKHWGSPAARHLGLALKSAQTVGQEAVWEFAGNRLTLGSKLTSEVNESALSEVLGCFTVRYPAVPWWNLKQRINRLRDIILGGRRLLQTHCRFTPRPVSTGGLEVEKGWEREGSTRGAWFDYQSRPYYLMESYVRENDLPLFFFPVDLKNYKRTSDGFYAWQFLVQNNDRGSNIVEWGLQAPEKRPTLFKHLGGNFRSTRGIADVQCGAAFALPLELAGPARLQFLLDGVASHPKEIDLGCPGLLCVVSGEGLSTDLTEFHVVEDKSFVKRVEALKGAVSQFREKLYSRREQYLLLEKETAKRSPAKYAETVKEGVERRLQGFLNGTS